MSENLFCIPKQKAILHLFVSLPVGGAENLLLNTVRGLDSQRFRSVVCCIRDKGAIGEEIESLGFPVIVLGKLRKGAWDGHIVDDLAALIRSERIGLVHTHLYHANLYGRLAAKRAGVPAVASIHNTYTGRPKWHRRLLNRYLARYTHTLIAGSNEIREDILRWDHVSPKKLVVIPNSVDLAVSHSDLSREQARQRLGISLDQTVIGTVGRLEEQKGHRFLVDAVVEMAAMGVCPVVLIAGEGRRRSALEQQIETLGLQQQVRLLGTRRDLGDLFRAMDLFVMPSLWEGLSLAMLSAMAAGLPVVATRVGGVNEVLGDDQYGLTVPAGDASALAKGVAGLLTDTDRANRLGALGKQRVETHYSHKALIQRLQEIYREAAGLEAAAIS